MSEDFIRNGIAGSGIVAARWFAVLASVMLGAAAGASEPAEKAEDVPSLLKQFEKGRRARMLSRKSTGAFLLVKSPDGVGGAFLTTLWKQPVILTCARAWLEFSSPEVCDGDGRVFRIREALMSRERDLVILGYELPPGEQLPAPLKLLEGGSPLSLGSGVAACGRWTMGGKIISIRYGSVVGSGPNYLEVNIPSASGTCGFPLFTEEARVAGIVTGDMAGVSLRRGVGNLMAVRVDNLTVEEFSQIDMVKLEADRKLIRQINLACAELSRTLNRKKAALLCLKYAGLYWECEGRDWSCEYFQREAAQKIGQIEQTAVNSGLSRRQFRAERIPTLLLRHAAELDCVATGAKPVRCFGCGGNGRVNLAMVRKTEFVDSANFLEEMSKVEFVSCRFCNGSGRRSSELPMYQVRLPEPLLNQVRELLTPVPGTFCGFMLGEEGKALFQREIFYRRRSNLFRRHGNTFGETLVYRGNPRERRVAITSLEFQLGRLTEVALLVRCRGREAQALAKELFDDGNGEHPLLRVSVGPLRSAEDMPCDARGNPLLPVSYFDFTEAGSSFRNGSEPFWVIRVSLEEKAGLDRVDGEALVRAGAKRLGAEQEVRR